MNPTSFVWWDWVGRHGGDIRAATYEHLRLTVIAVAAGTVIAWALSLLVRNRPRWRAVVTGVAGVIYTIPSLAMFLMLVSVTGFTTLTAEIALVGYTLLILLHNILEGLDGIAPEVREAADAMGFRPLRRLLAVDLRLAAPAILTGIRVATVSTVGLVTVTGLIGMGGYGSFIAEGLGRQFSTPVVVGATLSVAMAIVLDAVLVVAEHLLTPWRRTTRRPPPVVEMANA